MRLRKDVVTEQKSIDVPVTHDDEISLAGQPARAGGLEHLTSTLSVQAAADGNLPNELVRKGLPEEEAHYSL